LGRFHLGLLANHTLLAGAAALVDRSGVPLTGHDFAWPLAGSVQSLFCIWQN
jgi:hypothetical protein